ncbi:MAG: GntR family transcriptional regulator [Rhodospirillales bacterium]
MSRTLVANRQNETLAPLAKGARKAPATCGPTPLYRQLAAALRQRISDGVWKVNDRISTLEELEAEFGVARVTVRQAVELLQQEGLVSRKQGKGTFVTGRLKNRRWLELGFDWAGLVAACRNGTFRALPEAAPKPELDLGEGLVPAAGGYAGFAGLQSRGGEPFVLTSAVIASAVLGGDAADFSRRNPLVAFAERLADRPFDLSLDLGIGLADLGVSRLLSVPLSAATVEVLATLTAEKETVMAQITLTFRADCLHLRQDRVAVPSRLSPAN